MTFEEFLLSCAKREDGTYPYEYDVNRPMDFMCLGTTPRLLQIVWNAAIEAALNTLNNENYFVYREGPPGLGDSYILTLPKKHIKDLLTDN